MANTTKNKVPVAIRLYKLHDLDILTFVETHKLDLRITLYCVLKAFSKKEYFLIDIPPLRDDVDKTEYLQYKKKYSILIWLDKEEDADVVEMLTKIQSGYRNNFIKSLLRIYLCNPMSEMFLNQQIDKEYFDERFMMFKQGKRMVDAGSEVKERKGKRKQIGGTTKPNAKDEEKKLDIKQPEVMINEIPVIKEDNNVQTEEQLDNIQYEEMLSDESGVTDDTQDNDDIADLFSSIIG